MPSPVDAAVSAMRQLVSQRDQHLIADVLTARYEELKEAMVHAAPHELAVFQAKAQEVCEVRDLLKKPPRQREPGQGASPSAD